jgi:hypothetical protein
MEITFAKAFYHIYCLPAISQEFRQQVEIRIQAETNFNFSVYLKFSENELKNQKVTNEFLNRFLELSIAESFT